MVDISVKDLNKFFVIGENLLQGLSFEIQEGECVAILGRNGCGKTTLFKILTGEMDYDGGEVYVNPNKKLGLISQIPKFPSGYTVEDVLRTAFSVLTATKKKMEALEAAMAQGATQEQLREYDTLVNRFQSGGGYDMDVDVDKICNGLGITAEQRPQLFDSLSGGEKTRINLARLLLEKTDILLLDEPTNDLDLETLNILEDYLDGFQGAIVAVSHDRYFLDRVTRKLFALEDGELVPYIGGYEDYLADRAAKEMPVTPKTAKASVPQPAREKVPTKFTFREQRDFETIDGTIAELEAKLEQLGKDIEANSSDYAKVTELMAAQEKTQGELDAAMERWMYLQERYEQIQAAKEGKA